MKPGAKIALSVEYTLLTPKAETESTLSERLSLTSQDGTVIDLAARTWLQSRGTQILSTSITLPAGLASGEYTMVVTLSLAKITRTGKATFTVLR